MFNSSYAVISFPWLHVSMWMRMNSSCSKYLKGVYVPDELHKVILVSLHWNVVFSLPAFRLLLIPAPLGGNVAIHCDLEKQRARLVYLLS